MTGRVVLVGGGPGDPDLMTVGGMKALRAADVVLYDHLAPQACLAEARPDAELIDVGKLPRGAHTSQERINELLVEHARAGRYVVRFKGGDSFVFGRGGEEAIALAEAGIPVSVIPGVSSSIAGPELAGIPVTHRGLSQGYTVVSGHVPPGHPSSSVDWVSLARMRGTIVVLMGLSNLDAIVSTLLREGLDADTPAAVIMSAATPDQRVVRGAASEIVERVRDAGIEPPAIVVLGAVAGLDLASAPGQ